MKYRKKPIEIYAHELTRENGKDIAESINGQWVDLYGRGDRGEDISHVIIPTLEGRMRADLGDFVIQGVKGEFYPCKPDIFHASYEPVDPIENALKSDDPLTALLTELSK